MATPVLLCVVGSSGSGKTTLIERLIPLLKARGLRVSTVKRTHHDGPIDLAGKDTRRHAEAGAERVVLLSPTGTAFLDYLPGDRTPESAAAEFLGGSDLVLIEGWRAGSLPKIEVWREELTPEPLCKEDPTLVALVTDAPERADIPKILTFFPSDGESLADWIYAKWMSL